MRIFLTVLEAVRGLFQMSFGIESPPTIISTTAVTPCRGYCLEAISNDVIIASITINGEVITALNSTLMAQGQRIYGMITEVTLTSGIAIVYNGQNG